MINYKSINIEAYAEEFRKNRRVVIENFLDFEFAEKLHLYYTKEMPKDLWCATYMPSLRYEGDWEWWKNNPQNQYNMQIAYAHACLARDNNKFSYFFYKTMDAQMGNISGTVHEETMKLFNGEEILSLVGKITGLSINVADKTFVSRYASRCFLSEHTDDVNGKVAFVCHLTKDWNPDWGGLYLDLRDKANIKTILPSFNKMVIFEVTDGVAPHSVTQVVDNTLHERISVSGWYN